MKTLSRLTTPVLLAAFLIFSVVPAGTVRAEVASLWYPLPAANNRFLMDHAKHARMLWAFDYGHALIYEQMWRASLTGDYDFSIIEGPYEKGKTILETVQEILQNPPVQAPSEETLSPHFTQEFSWLMNMFSWTHKLHWVVADVMEGEPLDRAKEILKYQLNTVYKRYPAMALPTKCKKMMVYMEGQPFSMRFRRNSPNANGLIWAYHYYQLAIYDALMEPAGPKRDEALATVLKKFYKMAEDPASNVPKMPMAYQASPKFYKEFPELSAIFDNLHQVHDVIGDILAISEPVIIKADDEVVKIGVPDHIKKPVPGRPGYVVINYDEPEVKKAQMNHTMKLSLDNTSFIIECDKNKHEE